MGDKFINDAVVLELVETVVNGDAVGGDPGKVEAISCDVGSRMCDKFADVAGDAVAK